jgi:hypothetical protein
MIASIVLTLGRIGEASRAAIALLRQMWSLPFILSLPSQASCGPFRACSPVLYWASYRAAPKYQRHLCGPNAGDKFAVASAATSLRPDARKLPVVTVS